MELCSTFCARLDGRGVWGRMDICIYVAESLCYSPETTKTWLNGYTPVQNKNSKLKKKVVTFWSRWCEKPILTVKSTPSSPIAWKSTTRRDLLWHFEWPFWWWYPILRDHFFTFSCNKVIHMHRRWSACVLFPLTKNIMGSYTLSKASPAPSSWWWHNMSSLGRFNVFRFSTIKTKAFHEHLSFTHFQRKHKSIFAILKTALSIISYPNRVKFANIPATFQGNKKTSEEWYSTFYWYDYNF